MRIWIFASVQRGNPEIEHRCQEVIDRCWQLGANNPIRFIHDVGAGGLSNALPELVKDGGCGGTFDLRAIPSAESKLSPLSSGVTRRRNDMCLRYPLISSKNFCLCVPVSGVLWRLSERRLKPRI